MFSANQSFISKPSLALSGEITVPGDKSITHRAIILAAIAKGSSTIQGFLAGDDCLATLKAFQSMAVNIEQPTPETLIIHGVGKYGLQAPQTPIDCGNSGTSLRLLAGLLSAQSFNSTLTGDTSLLARPMARICAPLQQMGATIAYQNNRAPLKIQGGKKLQGIHFHMPLASAQVKSCLLLAGIYAEGLTCLVEPTSSRDHTERLLTSFSYPLKKEANTLAIKADTELQATNIVIPGDISSAAFFIVAATLIPGSSIGIQQVGINPSRSAIITLLQMMGADITLSNSHFLGQEPVADIQVHYAPLKGIIVPVDLALIAIDEFPILCIAAAAAQGITVFRGLQELRVKESDRIKAIAEGLTTLGIKNTTYEDGLVIEGGKIQGGQVNSFNDHRIAMAFAIAGIIAADPVTIQNIEKVSTSFPHFIKTAQKIGIDLQEICHDY